MAAGSGGLVAGTMSMAAGEYLSVSSQADSVKADIARERRELVRSPIDERDELAAIDVERSLDDALARTVAVAAKSLAPLAIMGGATARAGGKHFDFPSRFATQRVVFGRSCPSRCVPPPSSS